jgi:methionine biosynthesis protein MetW
MTKENKFIGSAIKKHQIRFDLEIIAGLIEDKSKVLDIGCGNGELLQYLKENKKIDGRGLEISASDVSKAVRSGLSVIQGDAENDLVFYPDRNFDYAILSQTIQAMKNPKEVIEQMLRVAEYAIISLPNFAYFKNRLYLLFKGKMPVSETIPYQWFDTPNIHFCSIKDFEKLCKEMDLIIKNRIYLTNKGKLAGSLEGKIFANFFAEYGIFLITKNEIALNTESEFAIKNNPLFTLKDAARAC